MGAEFLLRTRLLCSVLCIKETELMAHVMHIRNLLTACALSHRSLSVFYRILIFLLEKRCSLRYEAGFWIEFWIFHQKKKEKNISHVKCFVFHISYKAQREMSARTVFWFRISAKVYATLRWLNTGWFWCFLKEINNNIARSWGKEI
jgi:hypothetical protein